MSFTLIDSGSENFEFASNVWNWKAAIALIRSFDIVGDGTLRKMSYNATGVKIPMDMAHEIGIRIRDRILPLVPPGSRMFSDLSVTADPDDMTLHRDNDDQWRNYSVSHSWLKEFSEFCLRSKGFDIF
jgi:hypothetical protein